MSFHFACIFITLIAAAPIYPAQRVENVQTLLDQGWALYEAGQYPEATAVYQQAVDLEPKSALAHYRLGMSLYQQENDKAALKHFKRTIKLKRKIPEGHIGVGLVYLRTKNRRLDARQELRTAAKLDPENPQVQYYLGLSYIGQNSLTKSRGYGAFKDGQKYFKQAIELDPNHPDAYYQLARSYEFPSRECDKAISLYARQVMVNPDHMDALDHFGSCVIETRQYDEGLGLVSQLIDKFGEEAFPGLYKIRLQLTASKYQETKQFNQSLEAYEAYLETIDSKERELYTNLAYVSSEDPTEELVWNTEAERKEVWRRFWAAREPDPSTEANERLIEHYRRVMYARIHFSRGQYPWDRRGEIYIRYGEPDDRQNLFFSDGTAPPFPSGDNRIDVIRSTNPYRLSLGTGGPSTGRGITFKTESWVYKPYGIELFFVDQMGRETYDYPLSLIDFGPQSTINPRNTVARLKKKLPEDYQYDYGEGPITVAMDVATFKDADDKTQVEVAFSVPMGQLGHVGDGRGMTTWLDGSVVLRDADFYRVASLNGQIGPIERPLSRPSIDRQDDQLRTAQFLASVAPGKYRTALAVRDKASERIGIYEVPVIASDYGSDTLQISDIRLASSIKPASESSVFFRNGLEVVPHPARIYLPTQPVYFYYEIYNLNVDSNERTRYRTQVTVTSKEVQRGFFGNILAGIGKLSRIASRSEDDRSVMLVSENEGNTSDTYQHQSIGFGESEAGTHTLTLTITDLQTGSIVSRSTDFIIAKDKG